MWRKKISYRFRHLPKYCVRTGALHKVQHSRMSSASQLITHWHSGVGSCQCRWRLRRVGLRNTWEAGPVNMAVFKLKLKMNRCCTFYNHRPSRMVNGGSMFHRPWWFFRRSVHLRHHSDPKAVCRYPDVSYCAILWDAFWPIVHRLHARHCCCG